MASALLDRVGLLAAAATVSLALGLLAGVTTSANAEPSIQSGVEVGPVLPATDGPISGTSWAYSISAGQSIHPTIDGGVYATGRCTTGPGDFTISRVDAAGVAQWGLPVDAPFQPGGCSGPRSAATDAESNLYTWAYEPSDPSSAYLVGYAASDGSFLWDPIALPGHADGVWAADGRVYVAHRSGGSSTTTMRVYDSESGSELAAWPFSANLALRSGSLFVGTTSNSVIWFYPDDGEAPHSIAVDRRRLNLTVDDFGAAYVEQQGPCETESLLVRRIASDGVSASAEVLWSVPGITRDGTCVAAAPVALEAFATGGAVLVYVDGDGFAHAVAIGASGDLMWSIELTGQSRPSCCDLTVDLAGNAHISSGLLVDDDGSIVAVSVDPVGSTQTEVFAGGNRFGGRVSGSVSGALLLQASLRVDGGPAQPVLAGAPITLADWGRWVPISGSASGGGVDDGRFVYAALGDSFSSGVGTEPNRSDESVDPCYRTAASYPFLLFEAAEAARPGEEVEFVFAACGGARTRHLRDTPLFEFSEEWDIPHPPNEAQLEHVPRDADLVTVGIGGNDAGFSGVATYCFAVAQCDEKMREAAGGSDPMVAVIRLLEDDVTDVLLRAKSAAPDATVLLVGYPTLLSNYSNSKRVTCTTGYSQLERSEVEWIQDLNREMNRVLLSAASRAGVRFIDLSLTEAGDERHGLCGSEPRINGLTLRSATGGFDPSNTLHPDAAGHAGYAEEILATGILDLPPNPSAIEGEVEDVGEPPVRISFFINGTQVAREDGDAVASLDSGSVPGCLFFRALPKNDCLLRVRVTGLEPGSPFEVVLHSQPVTLLVGFADSGGSVAFDYVTFDEHVEPGSHSLLLYATDAHGQDLVFATALPVFTECEADLSPSAATFDDVPEGAFYSAGVGFLQRNGITTGTSPTTYSPSDLVTRGQMATFLHRLVCEPDGASAPAFEDVVAGSFYEEAVAWLADSGITTGTSPSTFSPDDVVTRAQMATFLYRLVGEPPGSPSSGFSDVVAGSYYESAVDWLAWEGITTGTSPSTFSPDDPVTRAQMAAFLLRLVELSDWTP